MIAIIDYGMGNLRSALRGIEKVGGAARIIQSPREMIGARGIVLPGDGAFGQAMINLRAAGWIDPLKNACVAGVPFLGICVGMQLLFETSEEMGQHAGLGIFAGAVKRFPRGLKVPQMGWNQLHIVGADHSERSEAESKSASLLRDVPNDGYAYFVHSYYCAPRDSSITLATTDYGIDFASIVGRANVFGTQFHPEKSQVVGLKILENFVTLTK
ncbi:MAG: imidazole glycerol phosphate synthase subunit HisH [Chloroflexi bacterium]|nr:imidazole glycerol phosphate synthase subunit HisH [Chloroflexota bacterium]